MKHIDWKRAELPIREVKEGDCIMYRDKYDRLLIWGEQDKKDAIEYLNKVAFFSNITKSDT